MRREREIMFLALFYTPSKLAVKLAFYAAIRHAMGRPLTLLTAPTEPFPYATPKSNSRSIHDIFFHSSFFSTSVDFILSCQLAAQCWRFSWTFERWKAVAKLKMAQMFFKTKSLQHHLACAIPFIPTYVLFGLDLILSKVLNITRLGASETSDVTIRTMSPKLPQAFL